MTRLARLLLLGTVLASAACDGLFGPPPPEPVHHTVVRGDTLSKLARTHHTTVDQLKDWNGLTSDRIDVGQALVVGYTGAPPPEAPSAPPKSTTPKRTRRSAPATAPAPVSGLTLPPEQPCLAGPSVEGAGDEPAFAASAGLSREQVRGAMNAFLPTLQRCIDGEWPEGTLQLSITVACTGRVSRVSVTDSGGLDPALASCVSDTLRYAPFPAHDLPDGETFGYPMRFSK